MKGGITRRDFALGMLAFAASGCTSRRNTITVGTKNFTEQLILGEMLAQLLEANASRPQPTRATPAIDRRFYLAGTYICHQALLAGRIDLYVEYTGTALAAILKQPPMAGSAAVFDVVKNEYRRQFDLEVLPPLGFDNSFAIVMRGPEARRQNIKTISDAARYAPRWRMGVGYEFLERKDGFPGLAQKYGLRFAEAPRVMDLGLLYRALESQQVDVIAASNTDGLIAAVDLVVLQDDRSYFPPYDAVPIVRRSSLERHSEIAALPNRISGKISANDMRQLNYGVDGQHQDAKLLVAEYLRARRLIG